MTRSTAPAVAIAAATLLMWGHPVSDRAATRSNPEVSGVAPDRLAPSRQAQLLTVSGTDFLPELTLTVTDPSGQPATYSGTAIRNRRDTSFDALVTLASAGSYSLNVKNRDGGSSSAYSIAVRRGVAPPLISRVLPSEIRKTRQSQALAVQGSNFAPGLTVMITDPAGNVVTVNPADVTDVAADSFNAQVTLEVAGNYAIVVTTPSGGPSNSFGFTVTDLRTGRR